MLYLTKNQSAVVIATCTVSRKGFDGLRKILRTSSARKNIVHISKGNSIPWLKGKIWIVVKGLIQLRAVTFEGNELILGFLGPNQVFGEPFSLMDHCRPFALVDCELLLLPFEEAYNSPTLALAILESLSLRHRSTELNLAILLEKTVEEKVKAFFELIATDFGHPVEEGLMIDFKITHQDIANALGVTRVTITRILSQLQKTGWLKKIEGVFFVIAF